MALPDYRPKPNGLSARGPSLSPLLEPLEPRLLLSADIINVSSNLDDFRFVAGPGLPSFYNTYEAAASGAPTSILFQLGGLEVLDTSPADGWQATFDMSSLLTDTNLLVKAYEGAIERDTYVHQVDLIMQPDWMLQANVEVIGEISETWGYNFNVFVVDLDEGFETPGTWQWTPSHFQSPLIDLAGLRTGLRAGWSFDLQSTPSGSVFAYNMGYQLELEVLGHTIWDKKLAAGTTTGSYSVTFSPEFAADLNLTGLTGSASLGIEVSQRIPVFRVLVPLLPVPLAADLNFGLHLDFGVGLSGSITAARVGSNFGVVSGNLTAAASVGITGFGEVALAGGFLAKAGVEIGGQVSPTFSATYGAGTWSFQPEVCVSAEGSLYWDALFGLWEGEYSLFTWSACWPHDPDGGDTPDQPYQSPQVITNTPLSPDSDYPTEKAKTFMIDASASHAAGISAYGYVLQKYADASWTILACNYAAGGTFEIGPLLAGQYRLRTYAENAYGGFGYSEWGYFHVSPTVVEPQLGYDIELDDRFWTDAGQSDRDGIPETGEDVELETLLRNASGEELSAVYAYLRSSVNEVRISDDYIFYGSLSAWQSSWGDDDFDMFLDFVTTRDVPFVLYVGYKKNGNSYYREFGFDETFHQDGELFAMFEVVGCEINDLIDYTFINYPPDGRLQSGEGVRIVPRLKNTGNAPARDIEVTIIGIDSPIYVPRNDHHYPDLAPGETGSPINGRSFRVDADNRAFTGPVSVDLRVDWADGNCTMYLRDAFTLTVEPAAILNVSPATYDFGVVATDAVKQLPPMRVFNGGSKTLHVTNVISSDPAVIKVVGDRDFWLAPGASREIPITLYTTGLENATRVNETVSIESDGRIEDEDEDDRMVITGLVSDSVPIFEIPGVAGADYPDISGDWIVWQDYRNGNSDVFAYHLAAGDELQITTNTAGQGEPRIGGNLIAWIDNRNGNADVYGYDLSTGLEFEVAATPALEYLVGVDSGRIIFCRSYYEFTEGGNMSHAWNLWAYDHGTGQYTNLTGFTPNDSHNPMETFCYDADFGGGLLVWEDRTVYWETRYPPNYYWATRDPRVRKIKFGVDPAPVLVSCPSGFLEVSADSGEHQRFVWVDEYEMPDGWSPDRIWMWEDGSCDVETSGPQDVDHGYDVFAIGGDYIVYDKSSPDPGLFYWHIPTDQERLLTDELADEEECRMDGNGVVFRGLGDDSQWHIYYAFLGQPDLSVTAADIVFSDDQPVEGTTIDVTVTVHNINLWRTTEDVTVDLWKGDPDDGGSLWATCVIEGGIAARDEQSCLFDDLEVPVCWEGEQEICVTVSIPSGADNPGNNKACKILDVQDSDTEGPTIGPPVVAEYDGDGDGKIGADEKIQISWDVSDPSGVASVELLVDGQPVPITEDGGHYHATLDPLDADGFNARRHDFVITATDADPHSPASSEESGNFDVVPAEEITVLYDGVPLTDGQSAPIDFGVVAQGASGVGKLFMVRNDGKQALSLGGISVPAGFTVSGPASSVIAPDKTTHFTITLLTDDIGTFGGTNPDDPDEAAFLPNSDGLRSPDGVNENPFNFPITGRVAYPADADFDNDVDLDDLTILGTFYNRPGTYGWGQGDFDRDRDVDLDDLTILGTYYDTAAPSVPALVGQPAGAMSLSSGAPAEVDDAFAAPAGARLRPRVGALSLSADSLAPAPKLNACERLELTGSEGAAAGDGLSRQQRVTRQMGLSDESVYPSSFITEGRGRGSWNVLADELVDVLDMAALKAGV